MAYKNKRRTSGSIGCYVTNRADAVRQAPYVATSEYGEMLMTPRPLPHLLSVERPKCPKCMTPMTLQRVEAGLKGFENRVFECNKCFTDKTVAVSIDPMKSSKAKWAASASGELKPPE
jgi:hypothetical protein